MTDADQLEDAEAAARDDRAAEALPDAIIPHSAEIPPQIMALGPTKVFLAYQSSAIALSHAHDLLVIEKSRRIGITWAFAADDAVTAATAKADGGDDVLYISYSFDMAREYVDAAASFAKAFMGIDAHVGEYLFDDEDPGRPGETRQIKAFRIDFASGHAIQALSSAPRSLRGKQGRVRIDEAAFVDNLDELLKAAMALLIWGGQVTVMSTHNGVDHPFNQLIQRIRAGEQDGEVLRITFDDAIGMGLYERICLRNGEEPTEEKKVAFVAKIRGIYGAGSTEELDVIPSKSEGAWLSYDEIERAERDDVPIVRWSLDDDFGRKSDLVRELTTKLWCEVNLGPAIAALDVQASYGVGGDFARRTDLTDICVMKEEQNRDHEMALLIELRNCPITEQIFILRWLLERLRRWSAKLDQGNLGFAIAERMQQIFGAARVEMIAFREAWWLQEGPPIKSRFQDGRIGIVRDKDVASDLRAVKVRNGAPYIPDSRTKAKGEDAGKGKGVTRHADAAVAIVLASASLRSGVAEPFSADMVQDRARPPAIFSEDQLVDTGWGVATAFDRGPQW